MCNCPRCTAARRQAEEEADDIERVDEAIETAPDFWPHFVILRPIEDVSKKQ